MAGNSETGAKGVEKNETKPLPKCYAIFRPHEAWDGEYGFDWVRFKDEEIKTKYNRTKGNDRDTKEILGKYLSTGCNKKTNCGSKNSCPASHKYCVDINSWSEPESLFKKDSYLKYQLYKIANFKNSYFKNWNTKHGILELMESVPVLTILPGKEAKLLIKVYRSDDKVDIINPATLKFKWKDNTTHFSLLEPPDKNVSDIVKDGNPKPFNITLKCNSAFDKDEYLEIYQEGKDQDGKVVESSCIGKVRILANDEKHQRTLDAVLIQITLDIGNSSKTGSFNGGIETIKNILNQAYVTLKNDTVELFEITNLEPKYILNDGGKISIKFDGGLLNYLNNRVKNELDSKYQSYFKVYSIAEKCEGGTLGFSVPGTDSCIVFKGHNNSTVAHELLHSLKLPHSFVVKNASKYANYTYKALETDNLMDYSHWKDIKRISTFYWQWKIMNNGIK